MKWLLLDKCDCKIFREDLNFLEYPLWLVSKRDIGNTLRIKNGSGVFELESTLPLPVRLDKVLLYYLIHNILTHSKDAYHLEITRYAIAKAIFPNVQSFSNAKYERIMVGLERLKNLCITYKDSFFEQCMLISKQITIIDSFFIDEESKRLKIFFNHNYIDFLRQTKVYVYINFNEYRAFSRPVSLRLYEICLARFIYRPIFYIETDKIADLIPLEKRAYPSQIVAALKPAVQEINRISSMKIDFIYNKDLNLCVFKLAKESKNNFNEFSYCKYVSPSCARSAS